MEENILKWIEVGDAIQKVDVFTNKFRLTSFKIFYNISKNMYFSEYLHYLLILLFFAQIWELNISGTNIENDRILKTIDFLKPILLFEKFINRIKTYEKVITIAVIFFLIIIIISVINILLLIYDKINNTLLKILGVIQLLSVYYFCGPFFHIYIFPLFTTIESISTKNYFILIIFILGFIFCIFMIINVIIISFYMNDINTIDGINYKSKINNRYMTSIITIKFIYFIFETVLVLVLPDNTLFLYFHQIVFVLLNLFISIYSYKNLYYYNYNIDICHHFGWYFSTWFSICILFKNLTGTKDMTLFLIIGFLLLGIASHFSKKYIEFKLLTEFNMLSNNNLKDIEIYGNALLQLSKNEDPKSNTLLLGIIKKSEESLKSYPEMDELYSKYVNKAVEHKLFDTLKEQKVFCLIGVIYVIKIEKSKNKADSLLHRSYFLINKLKNVPLTIFNTMKINPNNHIQAYYKYVLLEELKSYIINKIKKPRNKSSIKNLQLSAVILYNQLVDLFKLEIYDSTCSQIEYFDILKNNINTETMTENLLKTGENILSSRNNIIKIWNKMVDINPLDSESEKDYMIFLDLLLQDEYLKKEELKKYREKKEEFYSERHHIYFDLFNQEKSAILLCDGYSFNGKIFYYTPNFAPLFGFTEKEISNITIDDLLPDAIQNFHKYILEENIKYTNLMAIFKTKKSLLLKGKNGLLFNIYLFLRVLPNLQYGQNYILYIQKNEEKNFMIVLDEKMLIDGYTESGEINSNFTVNNVANYGLSQLVIGYHIGLMIPEIILQIDYDKKNHRFFFLKENIDLKGYFYPTHNTKEMSVKIKKILDNIKEKKLMKNKIEDNNEKLKIKEEFNDFIKEINSQSKRAYSIFYKIECRKFIEGKYRYYKIHISNDLLSDNFNDILLNPKNYISNTDVNIKENNHITNNNTNINYKMIKLKINSNKNNQVNIKKDNNMNKEGDNNNINENSKDININQLNFSQPTSNSSSILSKMNKESNEFYKLREEIINKKDFTNIKMIKYLVLFYIFFIIGLGIYDFCYTRNRINSLVKFLKENIYFYESKIACANIYNSALNLRLLRNNTINNNDCPNSNCTSFYSELLEESYTEVRKLKYDLNNFYKEYQDIFKRRMKIELKSFKIKTSEYLYFDIDNYISFLDANGLKIIANISNYFGYGDSFFTFPRAQILDIYIDNLLSASYNFYYSDIFKGFEGKEKIKLYLKYSNNSPLRLILAVSGFLIIIIFIHYLISRIYSLEIFYLDKLINFSSTNFDEYLKKLDELKKNLRKENNDDEDKNMDDIDKDEELIENNDNKSKNKEIKNNLNKNKLKIKKKKNKQNKQHLQKLKKRKVMSNYFFRTNLYFAIKLSFSFIIIVINFIISIAIFSNFKKNYNNLENSLVDINNIYFNIFQTYLNMKKQIEKFFSSKNGEDIIIPDDSELSQSKLGNTLFDILHNNKYNKEYLDKLRILYNENACKLLIKNSSNDKYCETLFSGILVKGLDQVIVQMSIIINNCIDDLTMLKKNKNLEDFYSINNNFYNYEILVCYYIFNSYILTNDIFEIFREDEKKNTNSIYGIINGIIIVFMVLIIFLSFYFIYQFKNIGNSFYNFIGIIPNKFISDDENFYDSIIKLGELLY